MCVLCLLFAVHLSCICYYLVQLRYIVRKKERNFFKCFFFSKGCSLSFFYLMANILHNLSLRMRSQSFFMSCNLSCAVLCFACCCGCMCMLVYVTSSLWSCWPFPLSGRWESDLPHCIVNVRLQSAVRSIQLEAENEKLQLKEIQTKRRTVPQLKSVWVSVVESFRTCQRAWSLVWCVVSILVSFFGHRCSSAS